jgi:hypothetical protein
MKRNILSVVFNAQQALSDRRFTYALHIVTCPWLIIMGSGFDDLLTHSFTVTLNYNLLKQLTINDCLRLSPFFPGLRVSCLPLWLNSDLRLSHFYEWRKENHTRLSVYERITMTTDFWILFRLNLDWVTQSAACLPFTTSRLTEYRSLLPTVHVIAAYLFVRKRVLVP